MALPKRWDLETDVLVVGAGNAGMPAALSAKSAGADVLVIEGNDFLGGLMRGSGGFMFFCNTHIQAEVGIEDHVDWGVEDEMLMSDFRAVPELVRTYVEGGADTVQWLEDLGLTWSRKLRNGDWGAGVLGSRHVLRTHVAAASPTGFYPFGEPLGQCGYALTVVLEKAFETHAIPVLYRHRMTRLHREPDGAVLGVQVQTPDGVREIRARRAVVLCAGGATTNEQLVRSWDPRLVNDACYSDGLPYMTAMGDALVAAQDVGGGLTDMSFVCFTPIHYGSIYYNLSLSAIEGDPALFARTTGVPVHPKNDGYQRIVLVANDGNRFINEAMATYRNPDIPRDVVSVPPAEYPEEPFIRKILSMPNPKNIWAIVDMDSARAMRWPLEELHNPTPMLGHGLHPSSVATGATLEELAEKIGVNRENFLATMERYNAAVRDGEDSEFGKPQPLYPIVVGPFYAAKLNIIRHTPAGGLRVNCKGQVLDRYELWDGQVAKAIDEERVIPHLYASGECAGFVGFRRAHRKTGPILTMGRISGEWAAAESPY